MKFVSASLVGRARFCPMAAYLQTQGVKPDASFTRRIEAGTQGHAAVTQEAVDAGQDRRCFVATYAYGAEHPATYRLRDWRDSRLMTSIAGRGLVTLYYRASPLLVSLAVRLPVIGYLLRGWVFLAHAVITRGART